METRKVQLAGNSTYTISLPKAWAEEQGLETGMPLGLRPRDGRLILETDHDAAAPAPVVDVTDASTAELRDVVYGLYALGYDEFGVQVDGGLPPAVRRSVSALASELAGLEVQSEDATTVRCRDLLDPSELSVPRVVSRLRFAALSAHRRATGALVEGATGDGVDAADRVEDHRRDAAAEAALVERYFQRTLTDVADLDRLGTGRAELVDQLRVAEELERVASLAVDVARTADEDPLPGRPAGSFTDHAERTRRSIEGATEVALSDASRAAALDAQAESRRCAEAVRSLADGDVDAGAWSLAVGTLARTADCGAAIGTHALRSALRREA